TSAASLLQAAVNPLNDKDYFSFTNAAGEQVIESYAAIRSGQYTLVYETGMAADHMEAIDRSVGGASFYFDLYRDGQPVISNVSGINHAAPPAVDKAELQILVIKARAMENTGYPQDVWEYFRSVLSTAETVLAAEEADQPQIDDARNLLAAAIEAMEDLAIDKSELQALIDAAESLENKGYPAGLWADFQTALQAARSILDNAYATKAQEYAARVDLWEAMAAIDAVETGGFHGECLSLNPGMTERDLGFSWYSDWEEQAASYVRIARKDAMNGGVFPDVYLSVSGETGNASTGKIWHTAEVSGLAPDTEYVYRVSNDGLRYSEVYSFKTGGAGDFRFIAVGDPQVDGGFQDEFSFYTPVTTAEGWADTVNRAVQHVPDARLIASVGDQVEAGSNEVLWTDFFAPSALRSLPLALTAGNHDSGENLDWHFCTPGNKASGNYWFKYGNAFFVVLDTSGRADASTIGEYITRFDATLEAAAEARSDTDWLFIIHHKSTASPGAHRNEADVRAFAAAIEDLADKYHVDFVLAGHDHLYSRSYFIYNHEKVESVDYTKDTVADPEGTVYFGLNTASGGKYYPVADGEWYTNVAIQTYVPNYTVVDVREDRVSFRTYRTDSDEAIDTYTVIQTLDKQPQNAPAGLSGQRPASEGAKGRIIGTSDGMEYSMDGQVWQSCGDGYTELAPGVYYVRYKGNASFFAGAAVSVTVPVYSSGTGEPEDPQPGPVILTVYDGDTPKKEFTQSDLDRMAQVTNPYSAVNTWPAYSEFYGVTGIPLMSLFAMAGVNPSDEQEIRFYATDGFYTTLKMSDLTAPRYYFDSNGNRGAAVPPVISQGDNGWSLYFGQRTAREQIRQAYVDRLERIVIGAYADQWGSVIADPVSGSTVKAGDPIRLILPPGSGDAKIYYTLDGSEPTIYSTMYNETADRWFSQKGISENPPIETPAGIDALTVSARIIGIGRSDGEIMEFHYVVSESAAGGNPDETGGTGGTGGFGSLSAPGTVILNANAVPLAEAGSAAVSFTVDDLRERIEEAVSGEANGVLALEINTADYTTSVAATLPAESVKTMIDKGLSILTISSGLGSNSFDLAALQSMYAQGEGDSFELVIRIVDVSTLSKELQEVVEGRLLYQIEVLRNGKPITSFGAGRVMTRIPYTLPPGRSGYGIRVWYLSTEGELSEVECEYNRIQSYIQFMWNRLAYYMIDYDEEKAAAALAANPFEDVAEGAWYYDVVLYAYTRNLMTGTSAEPMLFSPNASLTRGMAVSILHRLAGGDTGYPGSFKDVAADRWYADAVNWAAAKGIVAGYGDGRFGPDDSITREQFAAILRNYADYLHIDTVDSGYQPAVYSIPANYTDAGEVSAWAMDAMRWANGQGLINGRTLNTLAPKDTATRAEAAAIFQRFLEGMSEDS
ncbi:MAG: S-layer homology domain-containing protein, partial [Clostridiales bacterium]|nr:S-layer homology domain-containing protein [Clostridiales bacterium]